MKTPFRSFIAITALLFVITPVSADSNSPVLSRIQ